MTSIKVNSFTVDPNGDTHYFGSETGTPEFLVVLNVLQKYLGKNNIDVDWDYNQFFFIITDIDEGIDNTNNYTQIIESIYEPFIFPPGIFESNKEDHLIFQIIYD